MKPMLASEGSVQDIRPGFIYEVKLDGYRALAFVNKGSLRLVSRNGNDMTSEFPHINLQGQPDSILDGEIVIFDESGNPSFQRLQNRRGKASYIVFDILELEGRDLTGRPLVERKVVLDQAIKDSGSVIKSPYTTNGEKLLSIAVERKLEGIIAKKEDSLYFPGRRTGQWRKIKLARTLDAVVCGYKSKKREISSLALCVYRGGRLLHIGNVGTGFSEKMMKEISILLRRGEADVISSERDVIWVKPEHVAEVKYHEISDDEKLRAPVFLRLRDDKRPEECTSLDHTPDRNL